jgi:wyosine [tRNA(Phe)-imidazoG37] synthetase (radical SAM superfamily)
VDIITFVPNGEPTLDSGLGETIELLSDIQIPTAVISNSSLIWRKDVRIDLECADMVSLKVDTVIDGTWKKLNRPHGTLELDRILDGIRSFAADFKGKLITETMIIPGLNDSFDEVYGTSNFLKEIPVEKAYISSPVRPPTEKWIEPASKRSMRTIYRIMNDVLDNVELLNVPEEPELSRCVDLEEEILAITSVHPMSEVKLIPLIEDLGCGKKTLESMVERGLIDRVYYDDQIYLKRNEHRIR